MEISVIASYSEQETIRLLLNKNVEFNITDTQELLSLKYIYSICSNLRPIDQALIEDFSQFSCWWLKSQDSIASLLEDQGLFLNENKYILVLAAILTIDGDTRITKILAENVNEDTLLQILNWYGITEEIASALYENYKGDRSEMIELTMEGIGFSYLFSQKLPYNILKKIFKFNSCKYLKCLNKQWYQEVTNILIKESKRPVIKRDAKIYISNVNYNIPYIKPSHRCSNPLHLRDSTLEAINTGNLSVIRSDITNIICQSKLCKVFEYVMTRDKAEEILPILIDGLDDNYNFQVAKGVRFASGFKKIARKVKILLDNNNYIYYASMLNRIIN